MDILRWSSSVQDAEGGCLEAVSVQESSSVFVGFVFLVISHPSECKRVAVIIECRVCHG
jgi:hypothetical protein